MESEDLVFQSDTMLKGKEVSVVGGGGATQSRGIFAFTPYSPGSGTLRGQIEVLNPWSTVPSTNSEIEIHGRFTLSQYNDALDRTIRAAARIIKPPKEDYSIVLNSHLKNGTFHLWANGASSAPDDWVLTGTNAAIARSQDYAEQGWYSAKLTNGASQDASLYQDIANFGALAGKAVSLKARVFVPTISPATTLKLDWGTGSSESSSAEQGVVDLEVLNAEIDKDATQLRCSIAIASGSSISVYIGKVWLEGPDYVYAHDLPSGWFRITRIWMEGIQNGVFNIPIDRLRDNAVVVWNVDKERSPRQLVFARNIFTPAAGKVLHITGQGVPQLPSADSDNFPIDSEYALLKARTELFNMLPLDSEDGQGFRSRYDRDIVRLARLQRELTSRARDEPGSVPVEVF